MFQFFKFESQFLKMTSDEETLETKIEDLEKL